MILMLLAAVTTAPSAPLVTGDFDGDGKADTAAIVQQSNGRRDVIATFHDGRRELVLARVDENAVLSVIPPVEIARLCSPLAQIVPDCSRQLSHRDRDGLSFKRTAVEVPALALWNGSKFSLHFSTWQPRPRK